MLECWNRDPMKRPTFEFLTHMFEDFSITTQNQYMEWTVPKLTFSCRNFRKANILVDEVQLEKNTLDWKV